MENRLLWYITGLAKAPSIWFLTLSERSGLIRHGWQDTDYYIAFDTQLHLE